MALPVEPWAALAAAVAVVVVWLYLVWKSHPHYGNSRGPVAYPILGCTLEVLRNKDRYLDWVTDYLMKDPTQTMRSSRLGIGVTIATANPSNVDHMLRKNFENYPKGKLFGEVLEDLLGKGIFNVDGHLWRVQRKVASYEFTTRSLRELVCDTMKTETRTRMLPFLEKAAAAGSVFDLQSMLLRFSFDTICSIAFGVDPGCLEPSFNADSSAPTARFAQAFDTATRLTFDRFLALAPALWHLKRALNVGSERQLRAAVAEVHAFSMSVIRQRRKELALEPQIGDGQHLDLLSRFMRLVDAQSSEDFAELERVWSEQGGGGWRGRKNFADEFLRDIVTSFFLAGRDTSSASLSWFLWELSRHPDVERAVYKEVAGIVEARKEAEAAGCFSYDELKSMQYLTAALSESLRLHPPVPVDIKVALQDDVFPDGTHVPKGARVGFHPYAMGRMESVWGPDCMQFKPERWLNDGEFQAESSFKFPVFQAGPRICLGKDMAMLQMKHVAAAFIQSFTLAVAPDFKPVCKLALTMPMKNGFPVTVSRRQQGAKFLSA